MRAFTADDEPGAIGEASRGEQAGDLADLGVVAQFTINVDGGDPAGGGPDGFPDRFGDRQSDGEADVEVLLFAEAVDVEEEAAAGAG